MLWLHSQQWMSVVLLLLFLLILSRIDFGGNIYLLLPDPLCHVLKKAE